MYKINSYIYDEIIIGCGISGLYWCYKTKPTNFIILEKLDRIGGRIYNIEWYNNNISMGGGVIKSTNSYTLKLSKELGLELGETVSKYHMIDLEDEKLNLNKPNENNFYASNKLFIKYLKRIYQKNKEFIKKNRLTWNDFLDLFLDLETCTIIKSSLLYKSFENSDIESVLYSEIDELLRTQDFKIYFIKKQGYTELLNKLVDCVGIKNIQLGINVSQIMQTDNLFQIITSDNKIFTSKKIILATESKSNIDFQLGYNTTKLSQLYQMVSGSNYIRIYSYHKIPHGLDCSYRTNGLAGKIIYINPHILMCCYTEENQASQILHLIENKTKQNKNK